MRHQAGRPSGDRRLGPADFQQSTAGQRIDVPADLQQQTAATVERSTVKRDIGAMRMLRYSGHGNLPGSERHAGTPVREELDEFCAADHHSSGNQVVLVELAPLEARRTANYSALTVWPAAALARGASSLPGQPISPAAGTTKSNA